MSPGSNFERLANEPRVKFRKACELRVICSEAHEHGVKFRNSSSSSARIVFVSDVLSSSHFDGVDADVGSGRHLLDIFVELLPSARFTMGGTDSE
jgi:hypothetical protein